MIIGIINMKFIFKIAFFLLFFSFSVKSIEDLGTVNAIGSSPLPGIMINKKDIPNSTQNLREEDIKKNLSKSIVDLMNENLSGLTVKDVQNGSFQKNVDYRGFTASPLLGEAQGLAIYLDGVRINESFGDTVQWELIPENAIRQVDLMSSNPAFGLNALGGSLSLTTKKGLDYKDEKSFIDSTIKFGSFSYHSELMEYGIGSNENDVGLYTSIEIENEAGWRDHSDGRIKRIYTSIGSEKEDFDLNLSFLGGSTDLNGNGVVPIELLDKRRQSVFTWPDKTKNSLALFYGNANYYTENDTVISSNFYLRKLHRNTMNADEVDAEECAEDNSADADEIASDYGFEDAPLCGEDNSTGDYGIILDQFGNAIESDDNIRKYGLLNKTFTSTTTFGGTIQYDTFFNFNQKKHKINVGFSYDQARTFFRSQGFLGQLTNDRTVTQLFNGFGQPIELVAEQEHEGNGNDPEDKERGDVGPAELEGKLNLYGIYFNDNFKVNSKTMLSASARLNLAFVELIDEFETNTYTRTFKVNGDHRYFRANPSIGLVYDLSNNTSLIANYKEANRAPSPVELSCADPAAPCRLPNAFVADPPLEQVISRGIEFGSRGESSSKDYTVNWSSIGFFNQNTDDILFVSSGTGLSSGFFKNFGKTNRYGVDLSYRIKRPSITKGFSEAFVNYSFLKATFQSAHTLPAANHPNGSNDIKAGNIIPGMPMHKLNAKISYKPHKDFVLALGTIGTSGVFLRGDESNQLGKTSPYLIFNAEAIYNKLNRISFFAKIDNLLNSKYETMGVLGEASSSEVNVPISELGDIGTGDTAVGPLDPNFLSPGQPISIFMGMNVKF